MSINTNTNDDSRFSISSRRFAAEMSVHLSSVEVYYGGAPVAVPFRWESQPGTPRVRFCETPLPPLTPPPSFLFGYRKTPNKKTSKPKGGILQFIPRLTSNKKNNSSHVSPASSESSSLYSASSNSDSASYRYTANNHMQNQRKSFDVPDGYESPATTDLCFGMWRTATPKPTRSRSTEGKNR